ncbi:MAG: PHP domain-containing protein [Chloroflexi bacterium]|nr:PHP domain-containing protein [Chloroflexota bacterium]
MNDPRLGEIRALALTSKIDLHTHTTASDGALEPEELVALAVERGLDTIAICDHDTTEALERALMAAGKTRLVVIPGVEISTDIPRAEVHILGYLIDFGNQNLQETLARMRNSRADRALRMVEKLAALGMSVRWERVLDIAGSGAIGRPHIAQALVEKGYVSSPSEAFQKYIGRNGPAYAERPKMTPEQAVELISEAEGIPVLAHPITAAGPTKQMGEDLNLENLLPRLEKAGLAGLEVYYPNYSPELIEALLKLAQRNHLLATGGSDFHGWGVLPTELGQVEVPREALDSLYAEYQRRFGKPYRPPRLPGD